jgi:hypothetical protein
MRWPLLAAEPLRQSAWQDCVERAFDIERQY